MATPIWYTPAFRAFVARLVAARLARSGVGTPPPTPTSTSGLKGASKISVPPPPYVAPPATRYAPLSSPFAAGPATSAPTPPLTSNVPPSTTPSAGAAAPVTSGLIIGPINPEQKITETRAYTSEDQPFYRSKGAETREKIQEMPWYMRPAATVWYGLGKLFNIPFKAAGEPSLMTKGVLTSPLVSRAKIVQGGEVMADAFTYLWERKPSATEGMGLTELGGEVLLRPKLDALLQRLEAGSNMSEADLKKDRDAVLKLFFGEWTPEDQAKLDYLLTKGEQIQQNEGRGGLYNLLPEDSPLRPVMDHFYESAGNFGDPDRIAAADEAMQESMRTFLTEKPVTLVTREGENNDLFDVLDEASTHRARADELFIAGFAARQSGQIDLATNLLEQAYIEDSQANPVYNKYGAYTWRREPEKEAAYFHDLAFISVQFGEKLNFEQIRRLKEYHQSWGTELFYELILDPLNLVPNSWWEKLTARSLKAVGTGAKLTNAIALKTPILGPTVSYFERQAVTSSLNIIARDWTDNFGRAALSLGGREEVLASVENVLVPALRDAAATSDVAEATRVFEAYRNRPDGKLLRAMSQEQFMTLRSHYNDVSGARAIAMSEQAKEVNTLLHQKGYALSREDGFIDGNKYSRMLEQAFDETEQVLAERILHDHPELIGLSEEARAAKMAELLENYKDSPWHMAAAIDAFSYRLGQSFIDQHRIWRGSALLDDTISGKVIRGLREYGGAGTGVVKSLATGAGYLGEGVLRYIAWPLRDVWTMMVLYTPRWIANNFVDSTTRFTIYGGNPLDSLPDLFFGLNDQLIRDLGTPPIELSQALARMDLGFGETIHARTYAGWKPKKFIFSFWGYEFQRQKRLAGAVAKEVADSLPEGTTLKRVMSSMWNGMKFSDPVSMVKALPGGIVDLNTYIEYTLRLRMFHRKYFSLLKILEPGFKGRALADVPAPLRDVASVIWKNSKDSPGAIEDMIKALTGGNPDDALRNLLVPPGLENTAVGMTTWDRASVVGSVARDLQTRIDDIHRAGRAVTKGDIRVFFREFLEDYTMEMQAITDANLDLREMTGIVGTNPADMPTPGSLRGSAPIKLPARPRGPSELEIMERTARALKKTRRVPVRDFITKFEDAAHFVTVRHSPASYDVTVLREGREVIVDIGQKLVESRDTANLRAKLAAVMPEILWNMDEALIVGSSRFGSKEKYFEDLNRFVKDPSKMVLDDASLAHFFAGQMETYPQVRRVYEGLTGHTINYEIADLVWEKYGRIYDLTTPAGAKRFRQWVKANIADAGRAPETYRAAQSAQGQATARFGGNIRKMIATNPTDGATATMFMQEQDLALNAMEMFLAEAYPGPAAIQVGVVPEMRHTYWQQFFNLYADVRQRYATTMNTLSDMIEGGNSKEALDFIAEYNKDFSTNFLRDSGFEVTFDTTGSKIVETRINAGGIRHRIRTSWGNSQLQYWFYSPEGLKLTQGVVPLRTAAASKVSEETADALYPIIYRAFNSTSQQADVWVDILSTKAIKWSKRTGRPAEEYFARLGLIPGKEGDYALASRWAEGMLTDAEGDRKILFGLGSENSKELLLRSAKYFIADVFDAGRFNAEAAREWDVIKGYIEFVSGEKIPANGALSPRQLSSFARIVADEGVDFKHVKDSLPSPLLWLMAEQAGPNPRRTTRWIKKVFGEKGLRPDAVVIVAMDDGTFELAKGYQAIKKSAAGGIDQLPVIVVGETSLERVPSQAAFDWLIDKFSPLQSKTHGGMKKAIAEFRIWLADIYRSAADTDVENYMQPEVAEYLSNLVAQDDLLAPRLSTVREARIFAQQLGLPASEGKILDAVNELVGPTEMPLIPGQFHDTMYLTGETESGAEVLGQVGDVADRREVHLEKVWTGERAQFDAIGKAEYDRVIAAHKPRVRRAKKAPPVASIMEKLHSTFSDLSAAASGLVDDFVELVRENKLPKRPFEEEAYRAVRVTGPNDPGLYGKGTYFTTLEPYAATYASSMEQGGKGVNRHLVSLKNPFYATDDELFTLGKEVYDAAIAGGADEVTALEARSNFIRTLLEKQGYDGIVVNVKRFKDELQDMIDEWLVFEPEDDAIQNLKIARARYEDNVIEVIVFHPKRSVKKAPPLQVGPVVVEPAVPAPSDTALRAAAAVQKKVRTEFFQGLDGAVITELDGSNKVVAFNKKAVSVPKKTSRFSELGDVDMATIRDALIAKARKQGLKLPTETVDKNLQAAWEAYRKARGWTGSFADTDLKTLDTFRKHIRNEILNLSYNRDSELYHHYRFIEWQLEQFQEAILTSLHGRQFRDWVYPAVMQSELAEGVKQWMAFNEYSVRNLESVKQITRKWENYLINLVEGKSPALRTYTAEEIAQLRTFAEKAAKEKSSLVQGVLHGGTFDGNEVKGAIDEVNHVMLDYQTRNNFDQMMKNFFPFWMFPSRSWPFWMETMMLHPELVAFYGKIKSASRTARRQAGAMNSWGDPLPRLDGYLPVYVPGMRDPMWINPLAPMSFRFVFTPIEMLEDLDYSARYSQDNIPPEAYVVRELDETSRMYGFSMAPWTLWLAKKAFNVPEGVMPEMSIFPYVSLAPRWMMVDLVYKARRATNPEYQHPGYNTDLWWYPEVPWHDFLVEKQMYLDAKDHFATHPSMSREDMDAYAEAVENAVQEKGQNPLWVDAYKRVTESEAGKSRISFFTGIYPKDFVGAEADMIAERNELYKLKAFMNDQVGIELFDLPEDWEVRRQLYIDTINTPEGKLIQSFTDSSWVTDENGMVVVDPVERSKYRAARGEQREHNQAYFDKLASIDAEMNARLARLPIGTPWEKIAPIYDWASEQRNLAESMFDPAFEYKGKNVPVESLMEELEQRWYGYVYSFKPRWMYESGEEYPHYEQRVKEWEANLPNITRLLMYGRTRQMGYMSNPRTTAMLNNLHPDQQIPVSFFDDLIKKTDAEAMETYRKSNDSVFDALNDAWKAIRWDPFWEEFIAADNSYDKQIVKEKWYNMVLPTTQELYDHIVTVYGPDRFTFEEVKKWAEDSGQLTVQDRMENDLSENEEIRNRIWTLLSWVAPGGSSRDAFEEAFVLAGGDDNDLTAWYGNEGNLYQGDPEETDKLNLLLGYLSDAVTTANIRPPGRLLLLEYATASDLNTEFKSKVEEALGTGFWNILSYYGMLESTEKRAYRAEQPANYALLQEYYKMKDAYAVTAPIWAKYYYIPNGYSGASGTGSGSYYRNFRRGGGGGRRGVGFAVAPLSPTFRSTTPSGSAAGAMALLPKYSGEAVPWPSGMKEGVSPMLVNEVNAAFTQGQPLSPAAGKYLTGLSSRHPEWKQFVDQATNIGKTP